MQTVKRNPFKYLKIFTALFVVLDFAVQMLYSINVGIFDYTDAIIMNLFFYVFVTLVLALPLIAMCIFSKKSGAHIGIKIVTLIFTLFMVFSSVLTIMSDLRMFTTDGASYSESYAVQRVVSLVLGIIFPMVWIFFTVDAFSGYKLEKAAKVVLLLYVILNIVDIASSRIIDLVYGEAIEFLSIVSGVGYLLADLMFAAAYWIFRFEAVHFTESRVIGFDLQELHKQFTEGKIDAYTYNRIKNEMLEKL